MPPFSTSDNPPAFPNAIAVDHMDGLKYSSASGMSLRDYFAAKWLHGASSFWANSAPEALARNAYEIADAMLAERSKS